MPVKVSYKNNNGIQGSYDVPLDKSIAQRSAILGLSTNTGVEGEDIVSTKKAAKQIRSGTDNLCFCLLYTSPSPRDMRRSRMPSSA